MKKILSLITAFAMLSVFTGCNKADVPDMSTETTTTQVNDDDIYVKLKCGDVEFRMAYYDFNSHIREEIRNIIINDFGLYEFECLYVENEDCSLLSKALKEQFNLITNKYGKCKIKDNFMIKKTIELLKE